MPQNPVKTTLFVSQVKAGPGVTVTPSNGTGIVTIAVGGSEGPTAIVGGATPFPITGQAAASATAAGGAVNVAGAAGGSTSGTGGAATLTGGAGTAGNAAGGVSTVIGGAGQGTGAGGAAGLTGGASGAGATGNGGAAQITGGAALSTNGTGGAVSHSGGAGAGTGAGGAVQVTGGVGGATGNGGSAAIAAGAAGATSGTGGTATVTGGASPLAGSGGPAELIGGAGGTSSGNGGQAQVTGGAAGTGSNGNGGDVVLGGGALDGTGIAGNVVNRGTLSVVHQPAASAQNTTATLTAAQVLSGIITSNPSGAINLTLPLATAMDTAIPNSIANDAFDFSVISIAGSTNVPTVVTNTGWTIVGSLVFTAVAGNAGRFRAQKTGAGAWTLFRLS